jgi:hypothetical protein
MTPLERLLAEELPTGTFGHARPPAPDRRLARPWTPEEQAEHRAVLEEALDGWQSDDEHDQRKRAYSRDRAREHRHLRVIDGEDSEAAA